MKILVGREMVVFSFYNHRMLKGSYSILNIKQFLSKLFSYFVHLALLVHLVNPERIQFLFDINQSDRNVFPSFLVILDIASYYLFL